MQHLGNIFIGKFYFLNSQKIQVSALVNPKTHPLQKLRKKMMTKRKFLSRLQDKQQKECRLQKQENKVVTSAPCSSFSLCRCMLSPFFLLDINKGSITSTNINTLSNLKNRGTINFFPRHLEYDICHDERRDSSHNERTPILLIMMLKTIRQHSMQ